MLVFPNVMKIRLNFFSMFPIVVLVFLSNCCSIVPFRFICGWTEDHIKATRVVDLLMD